MQQLGQFHIQSALREAPPVKPEAELPPSCPDFNFKQWDAGFGVEGSGRGVWGPGFTSLGAGRPLDKALRTISDGCFRTCPLQSNLTI